MRFARGGRDGERQSQGGRQPEGVETTLSSIWSADLEPPERDEHAGMWGPDTEEAGLFYGDAAKVEEFAVAVVGLENALSDASRMRLRAAAEAEASVSKSGARGRAEIEAEILRHEAEIDAILGANPSPAGMLVAGQGPRGHRRDAARADVWRQGG